MATFARVTFNKTEIMMTTTLIAFAALLAAALFDLCVMLLPETLALQENGHSNGRFYSWPVKGDELTAPRRLLVLAVLIGCCTTMARSSWLVILLLAITLLAQGIILLFSKGTKPSLLKRHGWLVYCTAIVLALLASAAGYILGNHQGTADALESAATIAVILLALSPLLAMLANWLLSPLKIDKKSDQNAD